MSIIDIFRKKNKYVNHVEPDSGQDIEPGDDLVYEYCPRCDANLILQKGYSNDLTHWICKGCGEMLINPLLEDDSDIVWLCDQCEELLNNQDGFTEDCGQWTCTSCGFVNKIDKSEIYLSEDEYSANINSPYSGLSDEAVLELSMYSEESAVGGRDDIILVRNMDDGRLYVKKILEIYDVGLYEYLMENPVPNMPRICGVFESDNCLIVIEEYVAGRTLLEILDEGSLDVKPAVEIAVKVCCVAKSLHDLSIPIIHRDIKPSNIMIAGDGEVVLLDMNVAKWYKPDEIEDTRLLGTQYYAAPEQVGYGFAASSAKSDIYAIGMLLNVMITGKFPKEEKAPEPVWAIVEKCICLSPEDRYSDDELISALVEVYSDLG